MPFEVADYASAAALVQYGPGVAFMPVSAARAFLAELVPAAR